MAVLPPPKTGGAAENDTRKPTPRTKEEQNHAVLVLLTLLLAGVTFTLIIKSKFDRKKSRIAAAPERPPRPQVVKKKGRPPPINTKENPYMVDGKDEHTPTPSPIRRSPVKQRVMVGHKDYVNPLTIQEKEEETVNPLETIPAQETVNPLEQIPAQETVNPLEQIPAQETVNPLEQIPAQETVNPLEQEDTGSSAKAKDVEAREPETCKPFPPPPPMLAPAASDPELSDRAVVVPEPNVLTYAVSEPILPVSYGTVATPSHEYSPGGTVLSNIIRVTDDGIAERASPVEDDDDE
jgi:hypothetical protein